MFFFLILFFLLIIRQGPRTIHQATPLLLGWLRWWNSGEHKLLHFFIRYSSISVFLPWSNPSLLTDNPTGTFSFLSLHQTRGSPHSVEPSLHHAQLMRSQYSNNIATLQVAIARLVQTTALLTFFNNSLNAKICYLRLSMSRPWLNLQFPFSLLCVLTVRYRFHSFSCWETMQEIHLLWDGGLGWQPITWNAI